MWNNLLEKLVGKWCGNIVSIIILKNYVKKLCGKIMLKLCGKLFEKLCESEKCTVYSVECTVK